MALVKTPEKNVFIFDDSATVSGDIERLLFQNIGGTELVNMTRQNTVEGINPYYRIISNLSRIQNEFDPITLISRQRRGTSIFDIYPINLSLRIPDNEYLLNNGLDNYYYIAANGDLVIELVNMQAGEVLEVEIVNNATIYEVD